MTSPWRDGLRESTYEWSVRLFSLLRRLLRVNVKLHDADGKLRAGDIFLFNHFARFETFIPQYLIYQETGSFCRSVAAAELFAEQDPFADYLRAVGAIPHDEPGLLPLLAGEILRGRKVVVFPEGGMVKDRKVVDERGEFTVFSRTAGQRRKQHSGAAVLAMGLEVFKEGVRRAEARGDRDRLAAWAEAVALEGPDALVEASRRPTRVVPANITFYPIRVADNLLRRGAELMARGLTRRMSEELLIEGNILLEHTDMDIRLAEPVVAADHWRVLDALLRRRVCPRLDSLEEVFGWVEGAATWDRRLLGRRVRRASARLRDACVAPMYRAVSLNLSHLASCLLLALLDGGRRSVALSELQLALYVAVKHAQRAPGLNLHRSLGDPAAYRDLPDGRCRGLEQFLDTAVSTGLLDCEAGRCTLLDKLEREHAFDEVRLENLAEVYANEAAPVPGLRGTVQAALARARSPDPVALTAWRMDDEARAFERDRARYTRPRHAEINDQETATADAAPYLLEPGGPPRPPAVLLVHGFLASPAELASVGQTLAARGHRVLGVRLAGHGTSPWDLRERRWQDWLDSVRRGYATLGLRSSTVAVVGFSTGGALALALAAEDPPGLSGLVAVGAPWRFCNANMALVPLMDRANRLARRLPWSDGVVPFRPNDSENPDINYRSMPVRALQELRLLVDALGERLPRVRCPALLLQANADPVVAPESAHHIAALMSAAAVEVVEIEAAHHGILHRDPGDVHARLYAYLDRLGEGATVRRE